MKQRILFKKYHLLSQNINDVLSVLLLFLNKVKKGEIKEDKYKKSFQSFLIKKKNLVHFEESEQVELIVVDLISFRALALVESFFDDQSKLISLIEDVELLQYYFQEPNYTLLEDDTVLLHSVLLKDLYLRSCEALQRKEDLTLFSQFTAPSSNDSFFKKLFTAGICGEKGIAEANENNEQGFIREKIRLETALSDLLQQKNLQSFTDYLSSVVVFTQNASLPFLNYVSKDNQFLLTVNNLNLSYVTWQFSQENLTALPLEKIETLLKVHFQLLNDLPLTRQDEAEVFNSLQQVYLSITSQLQETLWQPSRSFVENYIRVITSGQVEEKYLDWLNAFVHLGLFAEMGLKGNSLLEDLNFEIVDFAYYSKFIEKVGNEIFSALLNHQGRFELGVVKSLNIPMVEKLMIEAKEALERKSEKEQPRYVFLIEKLTELQKGLSEHINTSVIERYVAQVQSTLNGVDFLKEFALGNTIGDLEGQLHFFFQHYFSLLAEKLTTLMRDVEQLAQCPLLMNKALVGLSLEKEKEQGEAATNDTYSKLVDFIAQYEDFLAKYDCVEKWFKWFSKAQDIFMTCLAGAKHGQVFCFEYLPTILENVEQATILLKSSDINEQELYQSLFKHLPITLQWKVKGQNANVSTLYSIVLGIKDNLPLLYQQNQKELYFLFEPQFKKIDEHFLLQNWLNQSLSVEEVSMALDSVSEEKRELQSRLAAVLFGLNRSLLSKLEYLFEKYYFGKGDVEAVEQVSQNLLNYGNVFWKPTQQGLDFFLSVKSGGLFDEKDNAFLKQPIPIGSKTSGLNISTVAEVKEGSVKVEANEREDSEVSASIENVKVEKVGKGVVIENLTEQDFLNQLMSQMEKYQGEFGEKEKEEILSELLSIYEEIENANVQENLEIFIKTLILIRQIKSFGWLKNK